MQAYSKVIKEVRRSEFKKADAEGKQLIKGSLYLLLGNQQTLGNDAQLRLKSVLEANETISSVYVLKEQLQALWQATNETDMQARLDQWCELAGSTHITALKRFTKMLREHRQGICNYAKHQLTTARIEAGNVAIGLIRKRARGIRDTDYFMLKVRQTATPDDASPLFGK